MFLLIPLLLTWCFDKAKPLYFQRFVMALLICDILGAEQLNAYAKIGLMIILH